jgi:hypothetical protein
MVLHGAGVRAKARDLRKHEDVGPEPDTKGCEAPCEDRPDRHPWAPRVDCPGTFQSHPGGVAEWLGRGLQNLAQRFNSAPRLQRNRRSEATFERPHVREASPDEDPC